MNVRVGDLAIVVQGLWPNVGRIVFVDRYVESHDFAAMGLGHMPGWRVRSCSKLPLETVAGPRMVGYSPVGSLKPIDSFTPDVALKIQRRMAAAAFKDAMTELAAVLKQQQQAHSRSRRRERQAQRQASKATG